MLHDNWYHMLIILLNGVLVFIEQEIIHKNNCFTVSDFGHFTLLLFCQFFQIFFDLHQCCSTQLFYTSFILPKFVLRQFHSTQVVLHKLCYTRLVIHQFCVRVVIHYSFIYTLVVFNIRSVLHKCRSTTVCSTLVFCLFLQFCFTLRLYSTFVLFLTGFCHTSKFYTRFVLHQFFLHMF